MMRKAVIGIIIIFICIVWILPFLKKELNSDLFIRYEWKIYSDNNINIYNNFSWNYTNNKKYNIDHNIYIRQKEKNILNVSIRQKTKEDSQNVILNNYSILTGQWNYRLTVFEQEFLKKNKGRILYWTENLSGVEYKKNYKKWLFIDIFTLQWIYINQFNQKNYYNLNIKINCGISQYFIKKQKCNISWEIWLGLPIDIYTKKRYIQWVLYKKPLL